jgi:hypothetical protein
MKKWIVIVCSVGLLLCARSARAQQQEIQQLLLDLQKLAQLRQILKDLKTGYQILYGGYTTIKNISEGNFNLHNQLLNSLLEVSPAVKNYKRVADIVSNQLRVVREYKQAFRTLAGSALFSPGELDYFSRVYASLFQESLKNLDALAMVLTSGSLRMSDDERLSAIDRLYDQSADQLSFLRHFNSQGKVLALQRAHEQHNVSSLQGLYGIPH